MQDIVVEGENGDWFDSVLVHPQQPRAPAVVLFHELFGISPFIRLAAQRLAEQGFLVLVPDLFWRQERRVSLDSAQPEDRQRAQRLYAGLDETLAIQDFRAAVRYLRSLSACTGTIGALGYCLGGKLAFLTSADTRHPVPSVSYYGVGIQKALDKFRSVNSPLLLHIAGRDHLCPPDAQASIIRAAEERADLVTVHVYPDGAHGFARTHSANYDESAARIADSRTFEFLTHHLGSVSGA